MLKEMSTVGLMTLYVGHDFVNDADTKFNDELAAELKERGLFSVTPDGNTWHWEKMSDDESRLR